MDHLPCELVEIIYDFDGRHKMDYRRCVDEINSSIRQWNITLNVLENVINLPRKTQIWFQRCHLFSYFILDQFRKAKSF